MAIPTAMRTRPPISWPRSPTLGAEPVPSPGPARDKVTLTFAASVVMLVTGHP
jgi:hypothetical protein